MVKVEPLPLEQRTTDRHPVIWCAKVIHEKQDWDVRLRNVSKSGALLECRAVLRPGMNIALNIGEAGSFGALISWVHGNYAGLRFHEAFEISLLAKSKPTLAYPQWVRPTYLGSSVKPPQESPRHRFSLRELQSQLEGFLKR